MGLINIGGENQGPPGPQGPQGPAGAAGANGTRGSTIQRGADPEAVTGALAGDLFILETNGLLYQYDGSQWVNTTIHVKGSRWYESGTEPLDLVPGDVIYDDVGFLQIYLGDEGFEGIGRISPAMWYFGEDVAEVAVPLKGDLFVVVSTGDVFQFDPDTGWGGFPDTPLINIKGADGAQGPQGDPGPGLTGGVAGQVPLKNSATDGDIVWSYASALASPSEMPISSSLRRKMIHFDDFTYAGAAEDATSSKIVQMFGGMGMTNESNVTVSRRQGMVNGAFGFLRCNCTAANAIGTWGFLGRFQNSIYIINSPGNSDPDAHQFWTGAKYVMEMRVKWGNGQQPNSSGDVGFLMGLMQAPVSQFNTNNTSVGHYLIVLNGQNAGVPTFNKYYARYGNQSNGSVPNQYKAENEVLSDDQWHRVRIELLVTGADTMLCKAWVDGIVLDSGTSISLPNNFSMGLGFGVSASASFSGTKGMLFDYVYVEMNSP